MRFEDTLRARDEYWIPADIDQPSVLLPHAERDALADAIDLLRESERLHERSPAYDGERASCAKRISEVLARLDGTYVPSEHRYPEGDE